MLNSIFAPQEKLKIWQLVVGTDVKVPVVVVLFIERTLAF